VALNPVTTLPPTRIGVAAASPDPSCLSRQNSAASGERTLLRWNPTL
jgi:hypothetical protein